MRREFAAGLLALAAAAAFAQKPPGDPDWQETEAPPPPALRTERLVGIDVPGSQLRFGIDPASITLRGDGIVRYVVVATSTSGTVNAMYEGIRCNSSDYRVYARHTPGAGWTPVRGGEWRPLREAGAITSRHTVEIARNGACVGHGTNTSPEQIVRDLEGNGNWRFRNEIR